MDHDSQLLSQVRYEIDRLFREHEIEIAFPQSTLHIQTAPALEKFLAGKDSPQSL
jgi:small-conductance mechanosensitive channel